MFNIKNKSTEGETMQTLNINNPKYFNPFLQTLENNTFKNYHTENCMLIATNFGTEVQKEEMKEIFNDHNDERYNIGIKMMTSIARKYLIKDILNNIKDHCLRRSIKARL